jgi:hypothetical protein
VRWTRNWCAETVAELARGLGRVEFRAPHAPGTGLEEIFSRVAVCRASPVGPIVGLFELCSEQTMAPGPSRDWICVGFASALLSTSVAVAETPGADRPPGSSIAASDRDARIEALERRIEQLETELHRRGPAETAPQAAATASPAAGSAPGTPPAVTAPAAPAPAEPFAFADFTWLTGNPRNSASPLATKYFTPDIRVDVNYTESLHHPKDDTISGSSEVFRSGEVQLTQFGAGGDLQYDNVHARLMTQFGLYSQATPRNDASTARGQWNLDGAYRYVSEAYGGYHFNAAHGVNVDAGLFLSYIGLYSFYQYDNWAYQSSFVSSNTPWYFNGVRIQIFTSDTLKIEPWLINGWQSYGRFNNAPGVGGQILWRPTGELSIVSNNYWGKDTLGIPDRKRLHTDDSIQVKYFDRPNNWLSKAAATLAVDVGCEYGGGVTCRGGDRKTPAQYFLGFMLYNRLWFNHDLYAITFGGGAINNPGRYLVLLPPVNGATAASGTAYFTENPGDPYRAWDTSLTFDYMPKPYMTWRLELNHRAASVPYFTGSGGVTPPGGNVAPFGSLVPRWMPDLRKTEDRFTVALLVKL